MLGLFSCLFDTNGGGGDDIQAFCQRRWAGDHLKIVKKELVAVEFEDISLEVWGRLIHY